MDGSLNCAVFSWNTSKTVDLSITPSFVHLYCKVKKVFLRERERERERERCIPSNKSLDTLGVYLVLLTVSVQYKVVSEGLVFPQHYLRLA